MSRFGEATEPASTGSSGPIVRARPERLELAEQRSEVNPPEVRIRAWEKVHGLRLPADAAHPILDVIAVSTRLTLEQVQEEQRARAARRAG